MLAQLLRDQRELRRMAWEYLEKEDFENASRTSKSLLKFVRSPNLPAFVRKDGNSEHSAYVILGLVCLSKGKVASASKMLELASKISPTPQLRSFGPNLSLADALLKNGEKQVVLSFLEECADFWDLGGSLIKDWMNQIELGQYPDFGTNLNYGKARELA